LPAHKKALLFNNKKHPSWEHLGKKSRRDTSHLPSTGQKARTCEKSKNLKKKEKMFGLEAISWQEFFLILILCFSAWMLVVLIIAWIKETRKDPQIYYEDYRSEIPFQETLQPITVNAGDYPQELLPLVTAGEISLTTTFYEESGLDEGYDLGQFEEANNPALAAILPEIQYQGGTIKN
jgi:hypothetical protein